MSSLCVYYELVVHIRPCGLCIVHSCTFSTMQWDDEMQQKQHKAVNVTKFSISDWVEVMCMNTSNPVQQSSPEIQSSNPVPNPVPNPVQ